MSDDNYPNITIKIDARIKQQGEMFCWTTRVHILGPDDVLVYNSKWFNSKRDATIDMLARFESETSKLLKEFGK